MSKLVLMASLSNFYRAKFYRSDASMSYRWGLCVSMSIGLMPTFGSGVSVFITGMSIVAWVVLCVERQQIRPAGKAEKFAILTFAAYFLTSLIVTQLRGEWYSGLWAMYGNFGFILTLSLFPILRYSALPYWRKWVSISLGIGGVFVGVVALSNGNSDARAAGFVGNPQILSYLSACTGLFCLCLLIGAKDSLWALYLAGLGGSLVAMLLAGGRAAILYFLLTAAILLVSMLPRLERMSWRRWFFILYLGLCSVAIGYEAVDDSPVFKGLQERSVVLLDSMLGDESGSAADQSLVSRSQMIRVGWETFLQSPVFGVGRQNLMTAANAQSQIDTFLPYTHLHNAYLTELVSSGILGLAVFLLVLVTPAVVAWRAPPPWKHMGIGFALFTALFSVTAIGFYHDIKVFYFCLVVLTLNALSRAEEDGDG